MTAPPMEYDPKTAEFQLHIYQIYKRMRDAAPVHRSADAYYGGPVHGRNAGDEAFYALSRFSDVRDAVSDWRAFSSAGLDEGATLYPQLNYLDPPRHDVLRRILSGAFTPRRIADLEPRIKVIAGDLVGSFAGEARCELVGALAAPLPSIVIGELIGVPTEQRERFRQLTERLVSFTTPEELAAASAETYELFADLMKERRRSPRDDLMTALLNAEVDGQRLTEKELLGFCYILLVAGNDTTTNLISTGVKLLAEHPDQRRRLATDPRLLPHAIEEMLRFESPVQVVGRTALRDVNLHGVVIPKGARVQLILGSANRDERQFPSPDTFDIERTNVSHVALGHGVHFCMGAALLRLEARIAFEELLKAVPEYGIDPDSHYAVSRWARSLATLHVHLN